jgi:RHS repeat-associated protein
VITTPENFITAIAETSDASPVYPGALTQTASYNNLNQLTNLSGQALTFDADGNVTSDGLRNYTWDAENRLVGITYPGQAGKATAFSYDGLSRRTAIASTPTGGGGAVTTSYIWCGARICQARNSSNAVTREYFTEGEYVPSSPAQPYYYGPDPIGSVRRVFASASSAPAYSYDAYGNALQGTAPLTDFNYAGLFYNADSGLYLTQYRAYDPVAARWLSRDPIGEIEEQAPSRNMTIGTLGASVQDATDSNGATRLANLYTYVDGNPISRNDPRGEQWGPVIVGVGASLALAWEWYEYLSHLPPLPPRNPTPRPLLPPTNSCNANYPQGAPPPEVRNYTPRPQNPRPDYPEPPEPPEWPR